MTYVYGGIFLFSVLLLPLYLALVRKNQREPWLLVLFSSVCVVNLGYHLISVSNSVQGALFANKIAYLGQVMMPLCMFIIISRLCGFKYKKWVNCTLIAVACVMLAIVCTTGYLDWYYTDVSLGYDASGATYLIKEYGVLHPANLIYVLAYFVSMIATIAVSLRKNKGASQKVAGFMLVVVLFNILMWIIEKLIPWEFETLSVSYLMSSGAFLFVHLILQDYIRKDSLPRHAEEKLSVIFVDSKERAQKIERIISSLPEGTVLTSRQMDILEGILAGKSRKEMACDLHLSENTVKMHTTSLFKILKVSSREEIFSLIKA